MSASATSNRKFAIAATDGTCPRCGAARAADQNYCLACGDALPVVSGRLAGARRTWLARIGWYPGDWVWLSLATLVVAAAGAAVAIAVSEHRHSGHRGFETVANGVSLREPATQVPAAGRRRPRPTPPSSRRPRSRAARRQGTAAPSGPRTRPAGRSPSSLPKTFGHPQALDTATQGGEEGPQPGRSRRLVELREPPARLLRRLRRNLRHARRGGRRRRDRPAGRFPARTRARSPAELRGVARRPAGYGAFVAMLAFTNLETFADTPTV